MVPNTSEWWARLNLYVSVKTMNFNVALIRLRPHEKLAVHTSPKILRSI